MVKEIYKNLYLFLVTSFLGWIYEFAIDNKPNYNLDLKLPFLFIYGIGFLIISYIYRFIKGYPWYIRFLIYSVILTIFEFLMGKISFSYYGFHTWKYGNGHQIDLWPSLFWGFMALLVEYLFL